MIMLFMIQRKVIEMTIYESLYRASEDVFVRDPREDADEVTTLVFRGDSTDDWAMVEDPRFVLFYRVWCERRNEDLALRTANRYARLTGAKELTIHNLTGYVQSDWWGVVSDDSPEGVHTLEQYLRGDVWYVERYHVETCDLGHDHDVVDDSVGEVFADSPEAAIEQAGE